MERYVLVKFGAEEYAVIVSAAASDGMKVTPWTKQSVLRAAERRRGIVRIELSREGAEALVAAAGGAK